MLVYAGVCLRRSLHVLVWQRFALPWYYTLPIGSSDLLFGMPSSFEMSPRKGAAPPIGQCKALPKRHLGKPITFKTHRNCPCFGSVQQAFFAILT